MTCIPHTLLAEKSTLDMDLDTSERIDIHNRIIESKPMLRRVFEAFHQRMIDLDQLYFGSTPGLRIEIGAGAYSLKRSQADILATDVLPSRHLDKVIDAQDMDLKRASTRVIFGQNCFHHIPNPIAFFNELQRVCHPGGGAILIEPYYSSLGSFIFKNVVTSENFDKSAPWEQSLTSPMASANQAASYVIFNRDKALFEQRFPNLKLILQSPLNIYLRYLFSGGLNFKQLLPTCFEPFLKFIEKLTPRVLLKSLALYHIIVIQRSHLPWNPEMSYSTDFACN